MNLFEKLRDRMAGKTLKRDVRYDGDGFSIMPYGKPALIFRWDEVLEVLALKHDLFSVDEICLAFVVDLEGNYVWTGEDDDGFHTLRIEAERRFCIDPSWFGIVAQPPFAANCTSLWKKIENAQQ